MTSEFYSELQAEETSKRSAQLFGGRDSRVPHNVGRTVVILDTWLREASP
jgi:hypothetical protein